MAGDEFDTREGFDVIGDVHGQADKLKRLLLRMGYRNHGDTWSHPNRRVIFVGDLIDRGPRQLESVMTAKAMVDAGSALIVSGNHEFNALAYHTPDPDSPGQFLRKHTDRNTDQHQAFLEEIPAGSERDEVLAWFMSLPLWLELGGIRVVHACWDPAAMKTIEDWVGPNDSMTEDLLIAASRKGSDEWAAIEHLLKGPEVPIEPPYVDQGGKTRHKARVCWWASEPRAWIPPGTRTRDGEDYPVDDKSVGDISIEPYDEAVPVVFGHYWFTGELSVAHPKMTCVDFSAAGTGQPLVAYRWSGETELVDDNLVGSW